MKKAIFTVIVSLCLALTLFIGLPAGHMTAEAGLDTTISQRLDANNNKIKEFSVSDIRTAGPVAPGQIFSDFTATEYTVEFYDDTTLLTDYTFVVATDDYSEFVVDVIGGLLTEFKDANGLLCLNVTEAKGLIATLESKIVALGLTPAGAEHDVLDLADKIVDAYDSIFNDVNINDEIKVGPINKLTNAFDGFINEDITLAEAKAVITNVAGREIYLAYLESDMLAFYKGTSPAPADKSTWEFTAPMQTYKAAILAIYNEFYPLITSTLVDIAAIGERYVDAYDELFPYMLKQAQCDCRSLLNNYLSVVANYDDGFTFSQTDIENMEEYLYGEHGDAGIIKDIFDATAITGVDGVIEIYNDAIIYLDAVVLVTIQNYYETLLNNYIDPTEDGLDLDNDFDATIAGLIDGIVTQAISDIGDEGAGTEEDISDKIADIEGRIYDIYEEALADIYEQEVAQAKLNRIAIWDALIVGIGYEDYTIESWADLVEAIENDKLKINATVTGGALKYATLEAVAGYVSEAEVIELISAIRVENLQELKDALADVTSGIGVIYLKEGIAGAYTLATGERLVISRSVELIAIGDDGSGNEVRGNNWDTIITGSTAGNDSGLIRVAASNVRIEGLHLVNNAGAECIGIYVAPNSQNVIIENNKIMGTQVLGVFFEYRTSGEIVGNTIGLPANRVRKGISAQTAGDLLIKRNEINATVREFEIIVADPEDPFLADYLNYTIEDNTSNGLPLDFPGASAAAFKRDNPIIFVLPTALDITFSIDGNSVLYTGFGDDALAVKAAYDAYDELSDGAKEILTVEGITDTVINALMNKINTLIIAAAKQHVINAFWTGYDQGSGYYTAESWATFFGEKTASVWAPVACYGSDMERLDALNAITDFAAIKAFVFTADKTVLELATFVYTVDQLIAALADTDIRQINLAGEGMKYDVAGTETTATGIFDLMGTAIENLTINRPITLVGAGEVEIICGTITIAATATGTLIKDLKITSAAVFIIYVYADDVTISGLDIYSMPEAPEAPDCFGILIYFGAQNAIIDSNNFYGENMMPIYFSADTTGKITNNILGTANHPVRRGIGAETDDTLIIRDNVIIVAEEEGIKWAIDVYVYTNGVFVPNATYNNYTVEDNEDEDGHEILFDVKLAAEFRATHATILAKNVGNVLSTDVTAVSNALTAFNGLAASTKVLLTAQGTLLLDLKERVEWRIELEEYAHDLNELIDEMPSTPAYISGLNEDDPAEAQELEDIAKLIVDINAIIDEIKGIVDENETDADVIAYNAGKLAYYSAEIAKLLNYKTATKADAQAWLDWLNTYEEALANYTFARYQKTAKENLDSYVSELGEYYTDDLEKITGTNGIVALGKSAIDTATDEAGVDAAYAEAIRQINEILTVEQIKTIIANLKMTAAQAKAELETDYLGEGADCDQANITAIYDKFIAALGSIEGTEALALAVEEFNADVKAHKDAYNAEALIIAQGIAVTALDKHASDIVTAGAGKYNAADFVDIRGEYTALINTADSINEVNAFLALGKLAIDAKKAEIDAAAQALIDLNLAKSNAVSDLETYASAAVTAGAGKYVADDFADIVAQYSTFINSAITIPQTAAFRDLGKDAIDAKKAAIDATAQAADNLDSAKSDAVTALGIRVNEIVIAGDGDYVAEDFADIVAEYSALINASTSIAQAEAFGGLGIAAIDARKTAIDTAAQLETAREDAISDLETYVDEIVAASDGAYTAEDFADVVAEYSALINLATNEAQANAYLELAKAAIDAKQAAIDSAAQNSGAIEDAKDDLDAYVAEIFEENEDKYEEDAFDKIVARYKKLIESAANATQAEVFLEFAIDAIDAEKARLDAEIVAAEVAAALAAAKDAMLDDAEDFLLSLLKNFNAQTAMFTMTDAQLLAKIKELGYSDENAELIMSLYNEYLENIDNAATESELAIYETMFRNNIDSVTAVQEAINTDTQPVVVDKTKAVALVAKIDTLLEKNKATEKEVSDIRTEYDALSAEIKLYVTNYADFVAFEASFGNKGTSAFEVLKIVLLVLVLALIAILIILVVRKPKKAQ